MMTPEQRIEAFWRGEQPDRIPYTIYWNEWRHTQHDRAWQKMFEDGLRVTFFVNPYTVTYSGDITFETKTTYEQGKQVVTERFNTPLGSIDWIRVDHWDKKFYLQSAQDYRIMTYIIEHTNIEPDFDKLLKKQQETAGFGIPHLSVGARSPYQAMLVDYAGLEQFAFHMMDFEEEVLTLYDALHKNFSRRIDLLCDAPGMYVSLLENFTAETVGPQRFKRFHLPIYESYFPKLHESGKIIGTHFDGKLDCCKELIASSPIDLIESLTPPPEGDLTLKACRKAWPEKLFWSNIQTSTYFNDKKTIRDTVLQAVEDAAPDGKRLAFEVSELIPPNWKESLPIVIEALKETQR